MANLIKNWRQRATEMRELRCEAKSPARTECQNCGTLLKGDFCHVCGQAAKEPRRAVIGLVQDIFVETLAIDGKLFRTIALLFKAPGVLARRYLDGQRVRYSPPFRLYLFASVFFFLAAFWGADRDFNFAGLSDEEVAEEDVISRSDETVKVMKLDRDSPLIELPANTTTASETVKNTRFDSDIEWLKPHMEKLAEAYDRLLEDPRLFLAQMKENLPRFLLLAPVVYALTLLLLYFYRRKFFVYDHFVVSLYMHAALYAYLLVALLISKIPVIGFLWWVPLVWAAFQPVLVQRQAYSSNWFSVIVKWGITNFIYWIAMLMIVLAGLGYTLYQS